MIMDELKKKILLDVFVTPGTVIPTTVGASLLLLSLVIGPAWGFFGFCLLLLGGGLGLTNLLLRYDDISKQAIEKMERDRKDERNRHLDDLDAKLSSDRDPRDQEALRNLRSLYDCFMEDVKAGKISIAAGASMFHQIEEMFTQCVKQLEQQHEIWLTSKRVTGQLRDDLMKQKSAILDDVDISVRCLVDTVNEIRVLGIKAQKNELGKIQNRLKIQLESAKATEKIIEEASTGDLSRFA
jgi:hypothetical protein